jgi:hypothetical protein
MFNIKFKRRGSGLAGNLRRQGIGADIKHRR